MTLGDKQRLFARLLEKLLQFIHSQGWEVTLGEGYLGDSIDANETSPHRRDGGHFKRLAQDLNLFVDGIWIRDGGHVAWGTIGQFWGRLHPLCRWDPADANHFGLLDSGVS